MKAKAKPILAEVADMLPEKARDIRTNGAEVTKKSVRKSAGSVKKPDIIQAVNAEGSTAGESAKKSAKNQAKKPKSARAKAKRPNEKITSASILKKLTAFGENYQIEHEQDFQEAARIYSEEAELIDQMRKRLKADGLTVMKTYKTGDCEVAHPLLSELPRHVESANKCLMTISNMIENRGAKKQKPTRELDQFRLHA